MSEIEKPVDQAKLLELAREAGKGVKTQEDLAALLRDLSKATVEAALNAELTEHLGYDKHASEGEGSGNSRNGFGRKRLQTEAGPVEIATPRDRSGTFEPQLVKKGQRRVSVLDERILSLYARGMTTREIVGALKELYDAEVSPSLISKVTDAVLEEVTAWQARPLDTVYPIVYLDGLVVKVRQDKQVLNKTIYMALGVNLDGHKELLGLWIAQNEGAKFWLAVLSELRQRGLEDIFIACVDGLKGFPEAIETVYPKAQIQLCVVHLMRNSLAYVNWKDRKLVAPALKQLYRCVTVEEAEAELERFAQDWDAKYPSIARLWRRHWGNIVTLFEYPAEIRRIIYTTNAIESLNSVIRKPLKQRKLFPTDAAALKVVYLASMAAAKNWKRATRDWTSAMNHFAILFEDRVPLN
jgi:putative transposase